MSQDIAQPPAASRVSLPALRYTLELYDDVVKTFYETKVQDVEKRASAVVTDRWRYRELPAQLAEENGLSLAQLERLVEWKITHGKFRPFLLPQIRKNDPDLVMQKTQEAQSILRSIAPDAAGGFGIDIIKKALDTACVLHGVGPATGTLLLSVFAPDHVPFFQDELYAWLCSGPTSTNAVKLKYNVKEYLELAQQAKILSGSLGGISKIKAWELEKAGFVIGHWDLVSQEGKTKVWDLMKNHDLEATLPVEEPVNDHSTEGKSEERKRKHDGQENNQQVAKSKTTPSAPIGTKSPIGKKVKLAPSANIEDKSKPGAVRQSVRLRNR